MQISFETRLVKMYFKSKRKKKEKNNRTIEILQGSVSNNVQKSVSRNISSIKLFQYMYVYGNRLTLKGGRLPLLLTDCVNK